MQVVNLAEKFARFSDHWSPKIAGELNDSYIKLVKFSGEFVWHHHANEDELFLVIDGAMRMHFRKNGVEREFTVHPGELVVVPRGVEHKPAAEGEVQVLLLEPKTTLNTGNVRNEKTCENLDWI